MSKAKTNALDALRALIAERQQYEQWISSLDAKREGTPEHVFERVRNDYQSRLDRVVSDIHGHAEELQLSISTLSSRLVEVAREEDTRREGLQEAELRAAVGEYEPQQWDQLRTEAEEALGKIAADRASLDSQLGELRAIQKLSEVGSVGSPSGEPAQSAGIPAAAPASPSAAATAETPEPMPLPSFEAVLPVTGGHRSGTAAEARADTPRVEPRVEAPLQRADIQPQHAEPRERAPLEPMGSASSAGVKPRPRTPPGGVSAARAKAESGRPDSAKNLKCPECGTANYPTEWYCERCGGELATM